MLRLGRVGYLNVLPVYHAFDSGAVPLTARLVSGVPAELNQKFLAGELDITPISSIAYARQPETGWVLPDVSISADGRVASILLFSRLPVDKLAGRTIAVTTASATSVVLLRILLAKYYGITAHLSPAAPDLTQMLKTYPAALLIGDDALYAAEQYKTTVGAEIKVIDLGEVWKQMTGLPMVFALWAIRRDYVAKHPDRIAMVAAAFRAARVWSDQNREAVLAAARQRYSLPDQVLTDYFQTIRYDLDATYQRAVETYFTYAAQIGILPAPVKLRVWGAKDDA
ncbi:MAG: menaquinone biosynthesis protein [Heliobacteriaceae bacterium]|nr:menaquinone biosynthesis protein [Heliobacteriaceae bacterium]MDD4587391.1 menaquinone biosynthesis protein [Heliobacteriaceae bacterium]